MYEGFANAYDQMMEEIPYEEWFEKLHSYIRKQGVEKGILCELGCGTGTMTEHFAKAGYEMIGIDNSIDMLAMAQQKKQETNSDILYLEQDMQEFELAEPADVIVSICDSMNYLLEEEDMCSTLRQVKNNLKTDGYFIFDLKTKYCFQTVMGNRTMVEQEEDITYIWENYFYEEEEINEYSLTIFQRKNTSDLFEKTEEVHHQKVYSLEKMQELLEQNGLVVVECLDEKMEGKPREDSERIYIVAKNEEENQ